MRSKRSVIKIEKSWIGGGDCRFGIQNDGRSMSDFNCLEYLIGSGRSHWGSAKGSRGAGCGGGTGFDDSRWRAPRLARSARRARFRRRGGWRSLAGRDDDGAAYWSTQPPRPLSALETVRSAALSPVFCISLNISLTVSRSNLSTLIRGNCTVSPTFQMFLLRCLPALVLILQNEYYYWNLCFIKRINRGA